MSNASQYYLVFPILNKGLTLFRGPVWLINENTNIQTITADDLSNFTYEADSIYNNLLSNNSRCIYITLDKNPENPIDIIKSYSSILKFTFNSYTDKNPIIISFAGLFRSNRKTKLVSVYDLESDTNYYNLKKLGYRVKTKITKDEISKYFSIVYKVCSKNKSLIITLEKFNSARTRTMLFDKILDLSTSLESLIPSQTEVTFKFSLYNSFFAFDEPEKRKEAYKLLHDLYELRSKIIHGVPPTDTDNKLVNIKDNLDEYYKITLKAINYRIYYESLDLNKTWDEHIKSLIIGTESKVI